MKNLFQIVFYIAGIVAIAMMVDMWLDSPSERCNKLALEAKNLRDNLGVLRKEMDNLNSALLRQQSTLGKIEILLRLRDKDAADIIPGPTPHKTAVAPPKPTPPPKPTAPAPPKPTAPPSQSTQSTPSTQSVGPSDAAPRTAPGRTTMAFGKTSTGSYVRTIAAPPAVESARKESVASPSFPAAAPANATATGLLDIAAIVSTSAVRDEVVIKPKPALPPPEVPSANDPPTPVKPPTPQIVPARIPAPAVATVVTQSVVPATNVAPTTLRRVTTTPATTATPETQVAPIRPSRMARERRAAADKAYSLSVSDQIVSGADAGKKATMAEILDQYDESDSTALAPTTNIPASDAGN